MNIRTITTAALAVATLAACAPRAENEQQYWDNNKKDLAELAQTYPGFKSLLDARRAKAEPMWKEAVSLTDKDAKAEKMKEVNAYAQKLTSKLSEVKYKSKGVRDKADKLLNLELSRAERRERSEAIQEARASLDEVHTTLTTVKPESEAAALALVKEQVSVLIGARSAIDRAYDDLKPEKKKKKKKKKKSGKKARRS